jgi:UDP-GlcNAc3NAcA epimerase
MHPRTKKMIDSFNLNHLLANIKVIDPAGFLDMISLESNSKLIMTDSGGVQKEACFYRVPCITLRDETEWVETVEAGWNVVANVSKTSNISAAFKKILKQSKQGKKFTDFGKGNASLQIIKVLKAVM